MLEKTLFLKITFIINNCSKLYFINATYIVQYIVQYIYVDINNLNLLIKIR